MNSGDLKLHSLSVNSNMDFQSICHWMENRFNGLPQFHTSIHLEVLRHDRLISNEEGNLSIPPRIKNRTSKSQYEELCTAFDKMNQLAGKKSFGLLYLRVRLLPKLIKKLCVEESKINASLIPFLSSIISVPVVLATISRKTSNHYESVAIGIKGVTNYHSLLEVNASKDFGRYSIRAGLHVTVRPEDLDHIFIRNIKFLINPGNLINHYLETFLIPEKEEIVKKLCKYTFNRCQMPISTKKQDHTNYKILIMSN